MQVFPRGFDMVPDVSRAVLNLSESVDMIDIENRWFGAGTTWSDSLEIPVTDKKLSWKTFLAPFIITAGTSFCLGNLHIATVFLLIFFFGLYSTAYTHMTILVNHLDRQLDLSFLMLRRPSKNSSEKMQMPLPHDIF